MPAHGIQSLVLTVVTAFVNPGERVVIPAPTYGLYRQACEASGAEIVVVPTRGLRLDLEAIAAAARGAKLVFVCDPNNPTGDALSQDEWARFSRRHAGELPRRRRRGLRGLPRPG